MKKILVLFLLPVYLPAEAQFYVGNGATLLIPAGSHIKTAENMSGTGTVTVAGTLRLSGSLSGLSLDLGTGTLYLDGASSQTLPAGVIQSGLVHSLVVDNAQGVALGENLQVSGTLTLSSGPLQLGNYQLRAAAISGGGASSYVKTSGTGSLRLPVAPAAAVLFPVGQAAYNPVQVTNNAAVAEDYTVRILDDVYTNGMTGSPISYSRVKRSWDIGKATSNAATNVHLQFTWNADEVLGLFATPALYHYEDAQWIKQTGTTALNGNSLSYSSYTGTFSPFSVQSTEVLPVTLLSFSADCDRDDTRLNWATATEQQNSHFEIERSADGRQWERIGSVPGRNTDGIQYYSFTAGAAPAESPYYRLRQVDMDGKSSFSRVIRKLCGQAAAPPRVYPNPAREYVILDRVKKGDAYELVNAAGLVIRTGTITVTPFLMDLSAFPSGNYFLRLAGSGSGSLLPLRLIR